jgi:hypothetical protein
MKKSLIFNVLFVSLFLLPFFNAAACSLDVKLINQDPYPAIPGDYVKLVFQINGVANPECGIIDFELVGKYPISFDPTENPITTINAGVYSKAYSSFLLAPYKVRVDKDALEGENPIETRYRYSGNVIYESSDFTLNIEDTLAEFEIFVKDYNPLTKEATFEILNIAESDIQALTVEIPKQEKIDIQGANVQIVGDLDSNEYTTADFTGTLEEGDIRVILSYTDKINKRRTVEKTIAFDPSYFVAEGDGGVSTFTKVIIILIIFVAVYLGYKKIKKKKK